MVTEGKEIIPGITVLANVIDKRFGAMVQSYRAH